MSEIVPWTDPGGTPCCCNPCYTDLENEPVPVFRLPWQEITGQEYALLLAGGIYTATLTAEISSLSVGWEDGQTRSETHSTNSNLTFGQSPTDACSVGLYSNESPLVNVTQTPNGFQGSYSPLNVLFQRHLATKSGKNYLNLSTLNVPSSWVYSSTFTARFSSLFFAAPLTFYLANLQESDFVPVIVDNTVFKAEPNVSVIASLTIDETTYTFTGGAYASYFSPVTRNNTSHSGYWNLAVEFSVLPP